MLKHSLFLILLAINLITASAQCNDHNHAFKAGEVVNYHAYYNWGFIWINAGQVSFSVEEATVINEPAYHLKSYGSTYDSYDMLFKVRDTFETKVDTTHLQPFEFRRITNEGNYHAKYHYLFNSKNRSIKASIQKEKETKKDTTLFWKDCSFDLLTMVYKARNIDYSKYRINEKIPIRMVVDGEVHDIYIRYLGKETIKNRDGRKFNCLKFSPLLVEGTIFKSGEDMTVWVTDDNNRIPIIVEAKILIGSVKAVFVDAKNTRHPMSAEVKE